MSEATVSLVDAIDNLRRELGEAIAKGKDQALRFRTERVELELSVEFVEEGEGGTKVSVKVLGSGVELGGKGGISQSNLHRVKLILVPTYGGAPAEVSDLIPGMQS